MINARAETLTEKPAFKHLVGSRRCIIPADGFYEWRKEGKRKVTKSLGHESFGFIEDPTQDRGIYTSKQTLTV